MRNESDYALKHEEFFDEFTKVYADEFNQIAARQSFVPSVEIGRDEDDRVHIFLLAPDDQEWIGEVPERIGDLPVKLLNEINVPPVRFMH